MKSQTMLATLLAVTFAIAGCDKEPSLTGNAGTDNRQAAEERMMDRAPPATGTPSGPNEAPTSPPTEPSSPSVAPAPANGASGTPQGGTSQDRY